MRASLPSLITGALIFGLSTVSDAYIDSVEPGDDGTSLVVTFTEVIDSRIRGNIPANAVCQQEKSVTYVFKWREAKEDAEWQSSTETYTYRWGTCYNITRTETFIIEGLEPGTTYEVRYNSGPVRQGTPGGRPDEPGTAVRDVTWGLLKSRATR